MSFVITLADEDRQFACRADQTILDAALEQGIALSYGCRDGNCGSCMGSLLSGHINYPQGQPGGIGDSEVANGQALFCKAVPLGNVVIKARVIRQSEEIEIKTLPVKVKTIDYLADDVVRLILQLPAVETFHYRAGQWVYFLLKDGRKRAFSIANAANQDNLLELQIRHAVGGVFTDFVFNQLHEGDLLRIEGPHGTFYFQQDEKPLLLVAGGTGFAPLKGIFEELSTQDLKYPVHLFWGSRAQKDLYQEDLVKEWSGHHGLSYTPVLSDADPEDNWQGQTGFVHQAVVEAYPDLSGYAVYMAGPPQMIEACKQTFIDAGLDPASLYYDSFDYSSDALNGMQQKDAKSAD